MEITSVTEQPDGIAWYPLTAADGGISGPLNGRRLRTWALVLASQSIPCRLETAGGSSLLEVPEERREEALHHIRLYESRNSGMPLAPQDRQQPENTLTTLSVLILLAAFHNLIRAELPLMTLSAHDWLQAGMLQAEKVCAGEWWRLVTALTLHGDLVHLLGNMLIGGIFVLLVCRQFGSGLAWSLLLVSGAFGNLLNACLQPASHTSVGASTAVFGAVGILAGSSVAEYRHKDRRRWGLPLAAALALAALLGTEGAHTDIGAHLFGLLAGLLLGIGAGRLTARLGCPGWRLQVLLALASAATVVAAWMQALA